MRLHSAGATVRHKSPFDDLEIPIRDDSISQEELMKWVYPNPGGITKLNESNDFIELCRNVTPEIVLSLLGEFNWRHRITAACYVAVLELREFEAAIGNLLLKSEVCFAGRGYVVALASLNSEHSVSFISRYLDYYLIQKDKWFDQGDAMGALAWLDKTNGTSFLESKLGLWNEFIENKEYWKLDKFVEGFEERMRIVSHIRERL